MENRNDLRSILPYIPIVVRSSSLFWPSQAVEALKSVSRGPHHSKVDSGELLFIAISDLRNSLNLNNLSSELLASSAPDGYALFFDDLMSRVEAEKWFGEVVPALANLLLRLPSLLESHYHHKNAQNGLRLLVSQESGTVFLSQELIGALLACSFFCLFPVANRGSKHLPMINFDHLFASLYENYDEKQENKLKCIIHYFKRICSFMPVGNVSFERKVVPLECRPFCISYPNASFWSKSIISLCRFEVYDSGLIEDQFRDVLEVDFANKYIGGGALRRGCLQEEIRFMINPELIAGMLFLPQMEDNEAIEIVGTERFSNYTGYASSFRFCGDYVDKKDLDSMGRRNTRIVAIDALCSPGQRQYGLDFIIREVNKAYCGFFYQCKSHEYQRLFQDNELCEAQLDKTFTFPSGKSKNYLSFDEAASTFFQTSERMAKDQLIRSFEEKGTQHLEHQEEIGIATGNWGCGAFGGDPELKATIQWLAASQALRPFILYYTFGVDALQTLDQVTQWIMSHGWTVGDLWNMLVEYSCQRLNGETKVGFFSWLLPSLSVYDAMMFDVPRVP